MVWVRKPAGDLELVSISGATERIHLSDGLEATCRPWAILVINYVV